MAKIFTSDVVKAWDINEHNRTVGAWNGSFATVRMASVHGSKVVDQ